MQWSISTIVFYASQTLTADFDQHVICHIILSLLSSFVVLKREQNICWKRDNNKTPIPVMYLNIPFHSFFSMHEIS